MVPEEWPAAAPAGDRSVEPARGADRGRLSTVRKDLFLPPAHRLTEQERALMTSALHGLVAEVSDDLRTIANPAIANDDGGPDHVATLASAGLLDRPGLVALLLRLAEEEQASASIRTRGRRRESKLLQSLISADDASVAAAAMALILARGRRQDRFGQLRLDLDDLGRDEAEALVFAVAAVLAPDGRRQATAMAEAAQALLARHDFTRSLDCLTGELMQVMRASDRLTDDFLVRATKERDLALLVHALASRAGIPFAQAADAAYSRAERDLALLLRMAGVSRACAAAVVSAMSDALGIASPEAAIDGFDALTAEEVADARNWLNLPGLYRAALGTLERING